MLSYLLNQKWNRKNSPIAEGNENCIVTFSYIFRLQLCVVSLRFDISANKPQSAVKIVSYVLRDVTRSSFAKSVKSAGTDLRIGQIGHGLGPRAFGCPAQLFPMTMQG